MAKDDFDEVRMRFIGLALFMSRENIAASWEAKKKKKTYADLNSLVEKLGCKWHQSPTSPLRVDGPGGA